MKTTSQPSLWIRTMDWLSLPDSAIGIDSTQYMFDRINVLQHEPTTLNIRLKQTGAANE
jgi:hypothetical protein